MPEQTSKVRRPASVMRAAQQRVATHLYEHDEVQAVLKMGGGKTAATMTAIAELLADGEIRCAVILAPKKVCQLVWPREHLEWEHLAHLNVVWVSGGPAQRAKKLSEPADIYVIGIDNTKWLADQVVNLPVKHRLFDLICIDELSRFKNPRGKRGKALQKVIGKWRIRWGLTGTPRPNGYEDQYRPQQLLTNERLWDRRYDRWQERYFMPLDYNGYRWTIRPEWRDKIIEDINTTTITIANVDLGLPPMPPPQVHWVSLPPDVQRVYKDMERKFVAEHFQDGVVMAATAAVASGKLCQIIQGFMYDTVAGQREVRWLHDEKIELMEELAEQIGGPVAIAYEFQEDLQRLRDLYPDMLWFGKGCSDAQALVAEERWNRKDLMELGLHPASAGHGLNLQFGGDDLIVYGMTWSAENYDQMLKRFDRPGRVEPFQQHLILAENTLDEVKYMRVIDKMNEQDAFSRYIRKV